MRAPDDLPRRRRRRRGWGGPGRGRVVLIVALVALFFLLTSLRGIAGFYTDYLWYDSLGLWSVQRGILGTQLSLALIFIAVFFLLAWTNLYVTELMAPPFRPTGPEDELLERYHDLVAGRMTRVRTIVAGVLALIAGSGASAEWNSWLLFINGGDFDVKDPEFNMDVGFYVFKLPFMSFVIDWLFASMLIVLIVSAVAHYLNGGIRVQPPAPRVSPQVKAHLSVLLALLALFKTADYYLQRFELTASTRGVVDGATYTDVHAQLPALNLLVLISVAAAALFIGNIWRRGWALPLVAVVLWGFVAIVVGGIYPRLVQWRAVDPNVLAKEEPYIERNIEATQAAMGLSDVDSQPYELQQDSSAVDLAANASTIRNIRLWDPAPNLAGRSFNQLQQIFGYYRMGDIDVDRYVVDGEPTQMNLAVRDLETSGIPGNSWEQEHLAYTHGYGAVMAPANATDDGDPGFVMQDIPVESEAENLQLTERGAGIYIGEDLGGYSVVDTGRDEVDYRAEDRTATTSYEGEDGVGIGSFFRKAAFALRFGDINPLLSSYLTGDSKVIYIRDVVDRVHALAPFLHADADPYPVVLDGEVTWVVDLYTTTDRYPYAQRASTDQLSEESELRHRFNYVRNSVKATVDAYDGTVTFYVMDTDDPIIDAYRQAFPELFTDGEDMPGELRSHLRYPEDMFRVQTSAWGQYHLDDPQEWYDGSDAWNVAGDPGTPEVEVPDATADDEGGTGSGGNATDSPSTNTDNPIPPYYQMLRLPGEEDTEFLLMRPFVPRDTENSRQQLTAFMVARMDPGHYGELAVYTMPKGDFPEGPLLARGSMRGADVVIDEEARLSESTAGTRVIYGNMLMLPIDNNLLYVQPLYFEAESEGSVPRLAKVILLLDRQVVIDDTLRGALTQMFGESPPTLETGDPTEAVDPGDPGDDEPAEDEEEPTGPGEAPSGSAAEQAGQLLEDADQLFDEADEALSDGDLATYQEKIEDAQAKVTEAAGLLGRSSSPATSTTTTAPEEPADGESAAAPFASSSPPASPASPPPASTSTSTTTTTARPPPTTTAAAEVRSA